MKTGGTWLNGIVGLKIKVRIKLEEEEVRWRYLVVGWCTLFRTGKIGRVATFYVGAV